MEDDGVESSSMIKNVIASTKIGRRSLSDSTVLFQHIGHVTPHFYRQVDIWISCALSKDVS